MCPVSVSREVHKTETKVNKASLLFVDNRPNQALTTTQTSAGGARISISDLLKMGSDNPMLLNIFNILDEV